METMPIFIRDFFTFLWGPCMLFMLVGVGMFLIVNLHFFPFRNFRIACIYLWRGRKRLSLYGEITTWDATMTSLGMIIGMGNIVGVSSAIIVGGPGVIFWMWVTALLGMNTRFAEILLVMNFREKTSAGYWVGGAMYSIAKGLGRNFYWMAFIYAILGMVVGLTSGNMLQSNVFISCVDRFVDAPQWMSGIVFGLLTAIVVLGGIKWIGKFSGKIVPFMVCFYVCICLVIIFINIQRMPGILLMIIKDAFTPVAATGGFAGASLITVIYLGIARGIFSNETGIATGSVIHAAASSKSDLIQASTGFIEIFVDTIIICTLSGIVILLANDPSGTPLWVSGKSSEELAYAAFTNILPGIEYCFYISIILFCYTTSVCGYIFFERCVLFIFGDKGMLPFRIVYIFVTSFGAFLPIKIIWNIADITILSLIFPNTLGIVLLSPLLFNLVRKGVKKNPKFRL